jgi:hypothetical protein
MSRKVLSRFRTSNPTWIRIRVPESERLSLSMDDIRLIAQGVVNDCARIAPPPDGVGGPRVHAHRRIAIGDSRSLPFVDKFFDAVITSPPYCTRIDYVVATLPELAIFGLPDSEAAHALRRQMLGTPVDNEQAVDAVVQGLPSSVQLFLREVREHGTKAAETYYHKYFTEYFVQANASLREIARVSKAGAHLCLVVQDSHFKDLKVDLTAHMTNLLHPIGYCSRELERHAVPNPFALNPSAKKYRSSSATCESVLHFIKE